MFSLHSEDVAGPCGALEVSTIHPRVHMRKVVPQIADSHSLPACYGGRTSSLNPRVAEGESVVFTLATVSMWTPPHLGEWRMEGENECPAYETASLLTGHCAKGWCPPCS